MPQCDLPNIILEANTEVAIACGPRLAISNTIFPCRCLTVVTLYAERPSASCRLFLVNKVGAVLLFQRSVRYDNNEFTMK